MAEFGEIDGSSPSNTGDSVALPSDKTDGKTQCEVSVFNGDCGIPADMVGSETLPDSPGLETANNSSVGLDSKSGIPRRSSIIKVKHICMQIYTDLRTQKEVHGWLDC